MTQMSEFPLLAQLEQARRAAGAPYPTIGYPSANDARSSFDSYLIGALANRLDTPAGRAVWAAAVATASQASAAALADHRAKGWVK